MPRRYLSLVLPSPGAALHLVDAAVTGERHRLPPALGAAMRCSTLKIWTLTILSCPDAAKVVQGKAYAAIDFVRRPPVEVIG